MADEELHTAVRMSLELTAEDDVAARGFDMGCPDYTKGEKANLKWHVVVQGVEALSLPPPSASSSGQRAAN